jgi:hypothetical protein
MRDGKVGDGRQRLRYRKEVPCLVSYDDTVVPIHRLMIDAHELEDDGLRGYDSAQSAW